MKKIILCGLTAVAVMLAGCTKDLTSDLGAAGTVVRGDLIEVDAVIDDTRLSADLSGALSWNAGDQIKVVITDGTTYTLDSEVYTINELNKVAIRNNTAYAIYPASMAKSLSGTTLTLQIPSKISLATPEDIFDYNLMKGTYDESAEQLKFVNLMGYLQIPIKGEKSIKSATLKTICRTTNGGFQPISNTATIDITADVASGTGVTMATNNTGFSWVQLNFSEAVDLSASASLCFPMPAGAYSNVALVLVDDKGVSNAIYASNSHNITRGHIKMTSFDPLLVADHIPASPTSLVGEGETNFDKYASCYMVPPVAGEYSFPCILVDGTTVQGGVTMEIKWAEEAGMVYDIQYDAASNLVSFKTNGKKGNVLLALTDNTYSGTTTVWLWHLWITDTPKVLAINGGSDSTKDNTYYIQDRVVGATWAPTSTPTADLTDGNFTLTDDIASADAANAAGVYFQYQNRVPLPRVKSLDYTPAENISTLLNTKCDVMYGFAQYAQYWSTSGSAGDVFLDKFGNNQYINKSIQNPNYEYQVSKTVTKHDSKTGTATFWVNSSIINNWGTTTNSPVATTNNVEGYCFWRSPNNLDIKVLQAVKTTHDPCPPGYIIENVSTYYQSYGSRHSSVKFARAANDDSAHSATTGYKIYGMYVEGFADKDGNTLPLYFPCAGCRTTGVTKQCGGYSNMGYTYFANTNNLNMFTYDTMSFGYGGNVQYGASGSSGTALATPNASYVKVVNAQAYHVRCVRRSFE